MHVKPITAEQASEQSGGFEPWAPGEYDFSVQDAAEETSSAGNEMIKLTLHVFDRTGAKRTVFDYLVSSEKAQWKVRHFAEAVGLLAQYEGGTLDPRDMLNRDGRLKLRIKPAQGQYSAQNAVNDYLPQGAGAAPVVTAPRPGNGAKYVPPGPDLNDDIPF